MNPKRIFDLTFAVILITLAFIPMLLIALSVKLTSKGSILYWSKRVGKNNTYFNMPKFRSMKTNTPVVATHLLKNASRSLTPIGYFLRKTSLDELPQLWSILRGDMSFVGPRPALFNQHDLIELRKQFGIDRLMPGLTGWAQINGRDDLSIPKKIEFEREYLNKNTFLFDINILLKTLRKVLFQDDIKH